MSAYRERLEAEAAAMRDDCGQPEGESFDWPEPQPLPNELPDVAAFEPIMLPNLLRPWICDIAERMACPIDYVAIPAIAGLGSIIGRKLAIRPQEKSDWAVVPNQWGLLVGRPGLLKTPAMGEALSPLRRLEAQACDAFEQLSKQYDAASRLAKLRAEVAEKEARGALKKALKDGSMSEAELLNMLAGDEPTTPTLRRYSTNDPTAAALGELLIENPNGLLVVRDELASLLKSLDREDNAEARGFYLSGWNGSDPYVIDRIVRGLHLRIPAVCLSMVGTTQPGRISEYVRVAVSGGAGDDGLIQRFGLAVWPDCPKEFRECDHWPDTAAKAQAFSVFEQLDTCDPGSLGAEPSVGFGGSVEGHFLRFDPAAQARFREWRADLERRLRCGDLSPAIESHFAKYRKLIPSLALIFHLGKLRTGPVDDEALLRALAWADYLETHAARLYASVELSTVVAARVLARKLRAGVLTTGFGVRDVYRKGWAHLTERQDVHSACDLLCDLGWLYEVERHTQGRPATIYLVNPRCLQ